MPKKDVIAAPKSSATGSSGFDSKLYCRLLGACSKDFRDEFGEEMLQFVRARFESVRPGLGPTRLGLWRELLRDLVTTAVATRLRSSPLAWRKRSLSGPGGGSPATQQPINDKEPFMETLFKDLKYALRGFAASPGFTLMALLLLGLGVGANTAMFSLVDSFLFRPHPWKDVDQLVWIYQDSDSGEPSSSSFPAFQDIASHEQLFSEVAAMIEARSASQKTETGVIREVTVSFVPSNYFALLGLEPLLGAGFEASYDQVGGPPTAIVSHRTWRRDLGSDRNVIGTSVVLNGSAVTVVGVGPPAHKGVLPGVEVDYWLSISAAGPVGGAFYERTLKRREYHWFLVLARMRPEVSRRQAQSAMSLLADRLATDYPELNEGRKITVFAARDVRIHPTADPALKPGAAVVMGIVGLVLLIACANLGNLLLARSSRRGRELAVRQAMGATRNRLVRQLLTESLVLALGGGALGVVISQWAGRLLASNQPALPVPVTIEFNFDFRILLFTLGVSLLTALFFGLAPALRVSRVDLLAHLKTSEESRVGTGRIRWYPDWLNLRNSLVIGQVAASLVLVAGAGLLIRSLINSQQADLGFAPQRLAVLQADVREAGYVGEAARQFFDELKREVQALPGVESVTRTSRLPVSPRGGSSTLTIEGYEPAVGTGAAEVIFSFIEPDYFRALGMPLRHGRAFSDQDRVETEAVTIVNRAFAERYLGTSDAVGRHCSFQSAPDSRVAIVGVVENSKIRSPQEAATPIFYRPLTQSGSPSRLYLVARSALDPSEVSGLMREALFALDPDVPIYQLGSMQDHVSQSLEVPRSAAKFLIVFGMLALLLAGLGLYSVVAFLAAQKRAEMGIRMALGATRSGVIFLFMRRTMAVVGVGLLLGLGLAAALTPGLRSLLFDVTAIDPLTYAIVTLLMVSIAALATYLPARRAARVDPLRSIRSGT